MQEFIKDKIFQTLKQLDDRMVTELLPIENFEFIQCEYKQSEEMPSGDEAWRTFENGQRWGEKIDSHYWFHKKITTDYENMYLSVKTGREGQWDVCNPQFMVYADGELIQGMDVNHTEVLLNDKRTYDIYLYAYSGMKEGPVDFVVTLKKYDDAARKLYYDIKVPYDVCMLHDSDEKVYIDIFSYLDNTVNLIDFRERNTEAYNSSVKLALDYIETEFYGKFCSEEKCEATAVCIGHTHIDVAWLWTLAQTREKVLRSFATVIKLMKQFPEYKFMSSQAQLYKYVKEQSPELYADIKEMVRLGRWEVEGAMWVEADCNLSSGESLVRQIIFGKKFFKDEFDVDSKILWLPDVFGYSAALPQILIKSGVTKFVTSKISWSETNKMPYDTFMWQGIDGTEILSYFLTAQDKNMNGKPVNHTFYNAKLTPTQTQGAWDRYQNKDINDEVLITYGYGDGGGGPTEEMLETGRRLEKGIPGCVVAKFDTATEFLNRLEEKVMGNKNLPKWVGELYLELHRGTYTSMAKNKKYNRSCEFLYQTAETAASINKTLCNAEYPKQDLNNGWEIILLNQFHDIIPGSSIKEVYADSHRQYEEITALGNKILDNALENIAKNIKTDGGILVYNPLSFKNSGIVSLNGKKFFVSDIPAKGYKVLKNIKAECSVTVEGNTIENKFFRVTLNGADIISIYDKINEREVVKKGMKANVLRAFEDYPRCYDNWEITSYYKDKMWEVNDVEGIEAFNDGVCAGIKIKRRFLDSIIIQKICLYDSIPRIDFDTYIDWKQSHIILKALFPVDVHTSKATYDIQFGTVERPTHSNTSWDSAKFEVCAHKFADVSENGYGVSLMNDCKYGYSVEGSDMSLTLLKSGTYPNPDADKCEHSFVYSLYPHSGNYQQGNTVKEAYSLNVPMYAVEIEKQDGTLPEEYSFVSCSSKNVIVETVKAAENDNGTVLRMYEAEGTRTKFRLDFGFDVSKCYITDLPENKLDEVTVTDNTLELEIKPFEIITLLVE